MQFYTEGADSSPLAGNNQIIGFSGMTNTENVSNTVLVDNWIINSRAVNSLRAFYSLNKYVIDNKYQGHFLPDLGSTAPVGGNVFSPPQFGPLAALRLWLMGVSRSPGKFLD